MKDFLMPLLVGVLTFVLAAGYMYWQNRANSPASATAGAATPAETAPANADGKRILPSPKDYSPQKFNTMIRPAEFQTNGQDQKLANDYSQALEGGAGQ
jgi:hypothetical protein